VDKTYDFECDKCPFKSTGWTKANWRDKRAVQHMEEHETGEPMQELGEFRAENGVDV
jgi:hypothetical protein